MPCGLEDRAVFKDHGRYIHVTTYAPDESDEGELLALECVVGENWVITAHDEPIPVLEEFASRVSGSGDTGSLDGPGFLAALLEWVLGSYSAAFERIEQRLEEFDIEAMRGDAEGSEDIERLDEMRKQVGKLRRALAAHRSALVSLSHPELEALGDHASSERYQSLLSRFESTVQEARDAREAIVGSFDVLIARGGHRTNEIMKVLTLASVILLPGALIAGVMGMNFKVGLFEEPMLFWVVLAVIAADRADHDRPRQAVALDLNDASAGGSSLRAATSSRTGSAPRSRCSAVRSRRASPTAGRTSTRSSTGTRSTATGSRPRGRKPTGSASPGSSTTRATRAWSSTASARSRPTSRTCGSAGSTS